MKSFAVYRSSAGSGKTFTLVKEYLMLILPDPQEFRHILAITFTNKAANEMKERVMYNLSELSRPADQRDPKINRDLVPALLEVSGGTDADLSEKAKSAHQLILHHYSEFSIGTIDSFSHRIVRSFAREFGLSVNFNVELDRDELLINTIDLLLEKVGDDAGLTKLLVNYLRSSMDEEKNWDIEDILLRFSRKLMDEQSRQHLEKLKSFGLDDFDKIAGNLFRQIRIFEQDIQALAKQAFDLIAQRGITPESFYYGKNGGIWSYFNKLQYSILKNLEPGSRTLATIDEDKWMASKTDPGTAAAINGIKDELKRIYAEIRSKAEKGSSDYFLMKAVTKTIYPMALLNELDQVLTAFKKQNSIVHISEFNRRISGIVMSEPVPFIYERLGERYHHILIDEFQDTSVLQWHNILPLMENALSYGYFNMVVGDGKQAIYRWRNGDVAQFASLPSIPGSASLPLLAQREALLKVHYTSAALNTNFRSKAAIIKFNNSLFGHLKTFLTPENSPVYESVSQEFDPVKTAGGKVSIEFFPEIKKQEAFRETAYPKILETIEKLKAEGFRLRDITILCRKNKDASEIAQFLVESRVEVVSSESLLLIHSPEVVFLLSLMRFLVDPSDRINGAHIVTYLCQDGKVPGVLNDQLMRVSGSARPGEVIRKILRENGIGFDPDTLSELPVYDLCESCMRVFEMNTPANVYLQFFLDKVLAFSRRNSSTPVDFLAWWEKNGDKLSVIVPGGLDAVNIMTIHKAKGLQFPVVIFPAFPEGNRGSRTSLWIDLPVGHPSGLPVVMVGMDKSLEKTDYAEMYTSENGKAFMDDLNVLYVALTRPEERLYIFSPWPGNAQETPSSFTSCLHSYLLSSGEWEEAKSIYVWGEDQHYKPKTEKQQHDSLQLDHFISTPWQEKITIRPRAPEIWNVTDPKRSSDWGSLVHTLLSKIVTADDAGKVIDEAWSSGMISVAQKTIIEQKIHDILGDPAISRFFAAGLHVKTEAEIILPDGSVYRPDRVILNGMEAIVIDYKTGIPDPHHGEQLDKYGDLLAGMNFTTVKKYLLYLDPVVRLEDCTLHTAD